MQRAAGTASVCHHARLRGPHPARRAADTSAGRQCASLWRESISAKTTAATDAATALSVYPNPSSGGQFRVQLAASLDGPARLDLLDLQGRRVSTLFEGSMQAGEVREIPVNLPDLASGLYLVRLQNGGLVKTQRVSVQH